MPNAPVTVQLRIEGIPGTDKKPKTIFEGPSIANGHVVTTTLGTILTHPADGTNANEYPFPVPTATAALAHLATGHGSKPGWSATLNSVTDDLVIHTIGTATAGGTKIWRLAVNFKFADLSGGRTKVRTGDSVLWALVPSTTARLLRLRGPRSVKTDTEFTVTVTYADDGTAVGGATITYGASQIETTANGQANITLGKDEDLKAVLANHITSNVLQVKTRTT